MAGEFPSDAELLDRIRRQDREALRALYQRHGRLVFGLVIRLVGDPATAEEVVQDVFVRVWSKAGSFQREKAAAATWILRIARNRAIDALRSRSRTLRAHPWDLVPEDDLTPERGFDLAEESVEVREALGALEPDQIRVLRLAYYQGKTHQEIAEALGEPLGTVKSRIRTALLKMRGLLASREVRP
jgi:RNA polymerase sigma-70 factor (ECF subfamily)